MAGGAKVASAPVIPPPPPGFTLDTPASNVPPPPPGFVLDSPTDLSAGIIPKPQSNVDYTSLAQQFGGKPVSDAPPVDYAALARKFGGAPVNGIDLSAGLVPKKPGDNPYAAFGGDVVKAQPDPYAAFGGSTLGTPTSTIGPAPKTSALGIARNVVRFPVDPIGTVSNALDSVTNEIENYTQEGRAEHPILSHIGDVTRSARELLTGGQSAGEPMGTRSGVVNNPVTTAISLAPGAAELGASATERLATAVDAMKAARAAKAAEAAQATEVESAEAGNRLLRTKSKDFRNAVVPGRAIVREGVDPEVIESANNARLAKDTVAERQHVQSIYDHLQNSISNLKEQQAVLLKHPTGEGFDIRPIVEDSYQKALADAKQSGSPEIVKAINKAREEMLKIPNDNGELIADRYLNFEGDEALREGTTGQTSAEEAHRVKQTFQGRSNYKPTGGNRPDTATQHANNLWKDVAAKVRLRLEDQVPGLGEVNSRIRDANAAAKLAEKRINTLRGMPALPSRMSRLASKYGPPLVKGALGGGAAALGYEMLHDFLNGD